MPPSHGPLHQAEITDSFHHIMSAHEAGHAILGVSMGLRLEAIYSVLTWLPTGDVRTTYCARFGRSKGNKRISILLLAAGAAGEILLNGEYDPKNADCDRLDLQELGASNFAYCVDTAVSLLKENIEMRRIVKNQVFESLRNFKACKVARGGNHVVLAKGSWVNRLSREMGSPANWEILNLDLVDKVDSLPI